MAFLNDHCFAGMRCAARHAAWARAGGRSKLAAPLLLFSGATAVLFGRGAAPTRTLLLGSRAKEPWGGGHRGLHRRFPRAYQTSWAGRGACNEVHVMMMQRFGNL